jgi:hypothetical protein
MLDLKHNVGAAHDAPVSTSREVVPMDNEHVKVRQLGICLVDAGMVAQLTKEESTSGVAPGDLVGRL